MADATFVAELVDEISGPAHDALEAVRELRESMRAAGSALDAFGGRGGEAFSALSGGAAEAWGAMGQLKGELGATGSVAGMVISSLGLLYGYLARVAAVMGAVGAATAMLVGKFTQLAVQTAAWREGVLGGLSILQKGAGAERTFEIGIKLATKLGLDPKATIDQLHELISKNFSARDASIVLTAMADLKVIAPKANIDKLVLAMSQMKSKGKLQMEELQGQMAEAGLNIEEVFKQLAKSTGKSTDEVRKMISAGKISGDQGIFAIVAAIKEMGGGDLGAVAAKASQSIGGLMKQLEARPQGMLIYISELLSTLPGLDMFKDALRAMLDATDFTKKGSAARTLAQELAKLANAVLVLVSGGADSWQLADVITAVTDGVRGLRQLIETYGPIVAAVLGGMGEGFREVWGIVKEVASAIFEAFGGGAKSDAEQLAAAARAVGKAIAYVAVVVALAVAAFTAIAAVVGAWVAVAFTAFVAIVGSIVGALAAVPVALAAIPLALWKLLSDAIAFVASIGAAAYSIGAAIVEGIVAGLSAGTGWVVSVVQGLGESVIAAVKGILGIASPSKVFAELGGFTAEGFAQGVDAGGGAVASSYETMVAPPAAPVASPAGSGAAAGANVSITVPITVQGGGGLDEEGAKSFAREATLLLERLAAEYGLSPVPS